MVFLEKEPGFGKIESLFTAALEKDDYLLITSVEFKKVPGENTFLSDTGLFDDYVLSFKNHG